ncbi:hypothetical protein B0H98_103126 [Vreelandella songnenensis]|uniref:SIS domain-containing protein n=1 Tax=Vreelandella songnenensis TaxID=1176243 RepID=A0A2T0V4T6_9GAMM|nr:hypothetical protein B0H98_103126 [Halomonas songnenensis]
MSFKATTKFVPSTGGDALYGAQSNEVVLVVSIKPYAVNTLTLAQRARHKGLDILAITDSKVSRCDSVPIIRRRQVLDSQLTIKKRPARAGRSSLR